MSADVVFTQILLALGFVMFSVLTVSLFTAAWRNHFWRRPMRPVVWAAAFVCSGWAVEFGKRMLLLPLQATAVYPMLTGTGIIADFVNIYLIVTATVFFYTLTIAYPDSHRSKGEPMSRTSHDGPYSDKGSK